MSVPTHIINLDLPPAERWLFLANYCSHVNELMTCYLNDLGGISYMQRHVDQFKQVVSNEYLEEIKSVSSICDFSVDEVLAANLYYDLLKAYLGCTAFAVYNDKMLHARNLDWHTDNNILSEHSCIFDFQKNGVTVFKSVSWFGFIGVLSGIKPGKFSLTLNAVLSDDSPLYTTPVTFLLREVLTTEPSFDSALITLENTEIASDCLLLLSGTKPHQKNVIERTPTRCAIRENLDSYIGVTNDYHQLHNHVDQSNPLQATSCLRFEKSMQLLSDHLPTSPKECLNILQDEEVIMNITVQQMVFDNQSGEITLIKT